MVTDGAMRLIKVAIAITPKQRCLFEAGLLYGSLWIMGKKLGIILDSGQASKMQPKI